MDIQQKETFMRLLLHKLRNFPSHYIDTCRRNWHRIHTARHTVKCHKDRRRKRKKNERKNQIE